MTCTLYLSVLIVLVVTILSLNLSLVLSGMTYNNTWFGDTVTYNEENSTFPSRTATTSIVSKQRGLPSYAKYDWPGLPYEEIGHVLVQKGRIKFVNNARKLFLEHLDEFLKVYEGRPDKVNMCGMRINHSYSTFLAIKVLQPTSIIESGVNAGHSTYIIRSAAGPNTTIYAIDPLEEPICEQAKRWIDRSDNTQYHTGKKDFMDFAEINWKAKIESGEMDPSKTLVLLDDHMDPSSRYPTILKHGFRHVLFEDNYKVGKGANRYDRAGFLPKQMFARTDADAQFFWSVTKRYAEFPPIAPPVMTAEISKTLPPKPAGGFLHNSDDLTTLVAPLFRPDVDKEDWVIYEKICQSIGVDPLLNDTDSYMQIANYNQFAYLEFIPLAPRLLERWEQ